MGSLNENYHHYSESLDKLGFCTFKVFEDETISQLKQLYSDNFSDHKVEGLYANHNSNPAEKGLDISRKIEAIVSGSLQNVFSGYEFFLGHFLAKAGNVQNEFALHQDWNIVDESKYKSYQVWIPLQLTYPLNGGMFVVPGSHKFFNNHRSGSYGLPVVRYRDEIKPNITNLKVTPGNVLIYHNGLFHGSHPNLTNDTRIAVIANFVEKIAPTYYFHKSPGADKTLLYGVTGDELIAHLPDLEKGIIGADLVLKGEAPVCPVDNESITYVDLVSKFNEYFPDTNASQIKQLHIAKQSSLEQEMNDKGHAVIDLLTEQEIAILRSKYDQLFGTIDRSPGRFTTLQYTTPELKKNIHDFIIESIQEPLQKKFKDFVIPVSLYYTKKAFTSGDIDLHADSSLLLNHQLEPHYALWIPLVDVKENNGCLTLIPESHKNQETFYGGTFPGPHTPHREWLRQFEVAIPLKAGQAVLFDNNLLHNSTPNSTAEDRICITFRMTHIASQYYSFANHDKETNDLIVYEEAPDYYMDPNWDGSGKRISGKAVGIMQDGKKDFDKFELLPITTYSHS